MTLLVDAEVMKLETDPSGRTVTGVVVPRRRQQEIYDGRRRRGRRPARPTAPSSCCDSANDRHPNGLANGSDQVGRNYMFHNCKAVVALAKERNDTVFQKTLGINDFYFATDDYAWPLGQHPDGRQVERRGDEGRGAEAHQAGAALEPRRRRRPRRRLLAHHRGPARRRTTA